MTEDMYNYVTTLHEKIYTLKDEISTLKYCSSTIEITDRTEGSTPIKIEVSDSIFRAIKAEKEAELEKLQKKFESL